MKQYILSSFVSKSGGGNKAAVVFDDKGLTEREMLELAKKNNFSETAFIDFKRSNDNRFVIRYFTPTEEVDICGHAALASFYVLKQLGYIVGSVSYHKTKAGELKVLLDNASILIEMKKPELVMQLDADTVLRTIDIGRNNIIVGKDGMISVISTGLKDIILEVDSLETLKRLNVKREQMISVCK
ncbi:MAG: PhzF family phenazine biosynthesis protein, partial [Pseudomonadota bacterium]